LFEITPSLFDFVCAQLACCKHCQDEMSAAGMMMMMMMVMLVVVVVVVVVLRARHGP